MAGIYVGVNTHGAGVPRGGHQVKTCSHCSLMMRTHLDLHPCQVGSQSPSYHRFHETCSHPASFPADLPRVSPVPSGTSSLLDSPALLFSCFLMQPLCTDHILPLSHSQFLPLLLPESRSHGPQREIQRLLTPTLHKPVPVTIITHLPFLTVT